jgi:D-xylose transport system substrate-binding protein
VALAGGKKVAGATRWADGEKKVPLDAIFLKAVPVTRANLDTVVKAGHISKDALCKGVDKATGPAACK